MTDKINPKDALNHFIAEHAPLINLHAKKLQNSGHIPQGLDLDDVHMAGVHGLMDALHRYDAKSEASFATYSGTRIRGRMLDHIHAQDYIPKSVRQAAGKIKKD